MIERDIQDGVHPAGAQLPPVKQMAVDYGCGFRTLRQALRTLVRHGSIAANKRGWRVRDIDAIHYHSSIVLITSGDRQGVVNASTPRLHEHIRAVERECSQHNLRLKVHTYDWDQTYLYPTEQWRELVGDESAQASVLGFIIWPIAMREESLAQLLVRFWRMGKPVAILDEGNQFDLPSQLREEATIKLFTMAASPASSRAVGRFLLSLGHRHVAYLSPYQSALWSHGRLRGLRQAMRVAGHEDGVHAFQSDLKTVSEVRDAAGRIYPAIEQLVKQVQGSDQGLARALHTLRWRIGSIMQEQIDRDTLAGMFESVLREAPECTAWLGANDYVALESLDFLRAHGRKVPEDVSVVGMDDGLEAHLRGLTSYNFNGQAVVRAMVGHILDPHRTTPAQQTREPVEIEGYVVVRQTTGRAK